MRFFERVQFWLMWVTSALVESATTDRQALLRLEEQGRAKKIADQLKVSLDDIRVEMSLDANGQRLTKVFVAPHLMTGQVRALYTEVDSWDEGPKPNVRRALGVN